MSDSHDDQRLQITYDRETVGSEWINTACFGDQPQSVLRASVGYHARLANAAEKRKREAEIEAAGED